MENPWDNFLPIVFWFILHRHREKRNAELILLAARFPLPLATCTAY